MVLESFTCHKKLLLCLSTCSTKQDLGLEVRHEIQVPDPSIVAVWRRLTIRMEDAVLGGGGLQITRQSAVKWFSRPHGEPSGVCTGHRKPHDSGSSFRTVVVRIWAK